MTSETLSRHLKGAGNSGALNGKRWIKQYSYNDAGQLVSVGEGTANADRTGLQIARTVSYTYDPWTGAQTEARYRNDGRRVVRHYLDNGLLDRVEVFQGSVTAPVYSKQLSYDPATWRIASVSSPEGWIAYEHNDYGQVSRVRTSVGQDVEYIYNAAGQLSVVRRHTSGGRETRAESRPQATVWAYMSARLSAGRS